MSNEEAELIVFIVWILIIPFAPRFSIGCCVIWVIPCCFLGYYGWDWMVYIFRLYLLFLLVGFVEIVVDWLRS